jgi:nicotinate phosphoribosyltransferase
MKMLSGNNSLGLYTDFYELTMAQGYFLAGRKDEIAVFDYFYRTNPYGGGFLVFAGLKDLLESLGNFNYPGESIRFLGQKGFDSTFLDFLKNFRFKGKITSVREGEIVFPNEPLVRVEGDLIETQLIETMLLNILNFQSLIATRAFRITLVSENRTFTDFGLRRAHGFGGLMASRAAIIGGAVSTSNVQAGLEYNIPVSGTMGHSWVQSYTDELTAFRKFAEYNPKTSVFLVDTYHTLKSGVLNAITVAKEMRSKGNELVGIRLDSGDLSYLSKKSRQMLDDADLKGVKIFVSNQLNEYVIKSLIDQGAPIDGFGVGTDLVTGKPDASLDGVYKLAECNNQPRMKLSETVEKMTLPGKKSLYRYYDEQGNFFRDGVLLKNENPDHCEIIYDPIHPEKLTHVKNLKKESIHSIVYQNGEIVSGSISPFEINNFLRSRAEKLPDEHKRFIMPHIYKVGVSMELLNLRDNLRKKFDRIIKSE